MEQEILMRHFVALRAALIAGIALVPCTVQAEDKPAISVEHGRYIAVLGGCNDCHTAGYAPANGNVPDTQWLQGSTVGFRGPWGTSYPLNVRAYIAAMSEDDWVKRAATMEAKPPMPWYTMRAMNETDLRSFYRFVKSLGPVGVLTPNDVPPGAEPKTPYVVFAPPMMPH
jgi:mono/diheme cytochrome c family protein